MQIHCSVRNTHVKELTIYSTRLQLNLPEEALLFEEAVEGFERQKKDSAWRTNLQSIKNIH